jgi:hypothetical protein
VLGLQDYALLATTTTLECLWAAFYATGEAKYVARLLALAAEWAEFSDVPDQVTYLTSIATPLPAELTVSGAGCGARWRGGGDDGPSVTTAPRGCPCAGGVQAAGGGTAQRTGSRVPRRGVVAAAKRPQAS